MAISTLVSINLDLLSVGVAVAGTALLGTIIILNNTKSITNRSFFYFSLLTAVWGISNYLEYRFTTITATLWALRLHLFISVLHAYFFFRLAYVFPQEDIVFPRWYRFALVPAVVTAMIVVLTPFTFPSIAALAPAGQVTRATPGPGMALFMVVAFGLLLSSLVLLLRRTLRATDVVRRQSWMLCVGMFLTAILILVFNVVLPNLFSDRSFIPLASLFVFPFLMFTSYAIYQHHLFNIKVFSTAGLVFFLAVGMFTEIIFSNTLLLVVFRVGIFLLVLIFGINLIRGVLREVEQRERIQRLVQELEKTNEQLSEFMSLATHEIRNPATFIRGFTAGALEGDLGELTPIVRDGMQRLYVRANDIIHLGNQYLNKSKLELNRISFDFVPTDIRKIVEDLVHEFEPAAAQQGLTLTAECDPAGSYLIEADTGKIKEVISNVIDNSIKYTPKGSVKVSVTRDDQMVRIQVADTGVGIPDEVIPKLFNKFSRADAVKANILGTGLGLYIAKVFIDAHHGTIKVESTGKDKGSTFSIELPLKQPEQKTSVVTA